MKVRNFAAMYILKIRGAVKIPDCIQLRDDKFTLLAYFRVDRPEKAIEKLGLTEKLGQIREVIDRLPFGKLEKLEL